MAPDHYGTLARPRPSRPSHSVFRGIAPPLLFTASAPISRIGEPGPERAHGLTAMANLGNLRRRPVKPALKNGRHTSLSIGGFRSVDVSAVSPTHLRLPGRDGSVVDR
jgi:hypothetical protein